MQLPETWPGILTLAILVCAIIGGALTAFVRFTDRNTPVDIGLLHGRMGVVGILLLFFLVYSGEEFNHAIKLALALFVVTVTAGVALYFIIRRKGILPKTIIFAHGVLAVTSLAILLFGLPL